MFHYFRVISVLVRILTDILNTHWNLRISIFYTLLGLSLPFLFVLRAVIIHNVIPSGVTIQCCMWVCNAHLYYYFFRSYLVKLIRHLTTLTTCVILLQVCHVLNLSFFFVSPLPKFSHSSLLLIQLRLMGFFPISNGFCIKYAERL